MARRDLRIGLLLSFLVGAGVAAASCSGDDTTASTATSNAGGDGTGAGTPGPSGSGAGSSTGPGASSVGPGGAAGSSSVGPGGAGGASSVGSGGMAVSSAASGGASASSVGSGGMSASSSTGSGGMGGGTGMLDCSAPSGAVPSLKLTPVATNLDWPLLAKSPKGDADRLFIVEQEGLIKVVKNGQLLATPFLDVSALVYPGSNGDERGLLGLAFHPDYAQNGRFFIHYSDVATGDTHIAEYHVSANPDVADPAMVATVLTQTQPEDNHNGGSIEFSPSDGMLYIFLGDGGGAEDQHGSIGNGQNLNTKLGKVLRIDVTSIPYTIPAGNMTGANVKPEIWDYGMRNPWRASFDGCTGDLYIGDVGQYAWEEIDVEPPGAGNKNYGWRLTEGNHCFNPSTNCDPTNMTTPPVVEYDHGDGCAVTGGYVYRGSGIPGLRGSYLYGDYCNGTIWRITWAGSLQSGPIDMTGDLQSGGMSISSFGQDASGEVYVVDHPGGAVYRIDAQ